MFTNIIKINGYIFKNQFLMANLKLSKFFIPASTYNIVFKGKYSTYSKQPKFKKFYFKVSTRLLTKKLLVEALNAFYLYLENLDVFKENPNLSIILLFKVKLSNGSYRNLSTAQSVNFSNFYKLGDLFVEYWSLKSLNYSPMSISEIVF